MRTRADSPAKDSPATVSDMNHRWTLSILLATFLGVAALLFLVRGLTARVVDLEARVQQQAETGTPSSSNGQAKSSDQTNAPSQSPDEMAEGSILDNPDLAAKLNWIIEKLEETGDDNYETLNEVQSSLFDLERNDAKIITRLRRLGGSKNIPDITRSLTPEEKANANTLANANGIDIADGRVTVRAVLNVYSLRRHGTQYPFELLAARYPSEKDYETLILVVGNRTPEQLQQARYTESKSATLALYYALRAAGFKQGEGTRVDPASEDPKKPDVLLANGDAIHMYVRYKYKDTLYIERVTDWLRDGETGEPLPADAFRFTGSPLVEDSETGDQTIVAALRGTIVSQYPNPGSLIEISQRSALRAAVAFMADAIPRPTFPLSSREDHFFVDFILTKEPLAFTARDQLPTFPPAPKAGESHDPTRGPNENKSEESPDDKGEKKEEEKK